MTTSSTSLSNGYYQYASTDYNSISGSVNFSGLGSGTDFNSIIDQLVEIESINKYRMETWKATWEAKMDSMRALNQRLEAVEEAAAAMDTMDEFLSRVATSSDSTVATGATTNEAEEGAYRVTVGADVKHIISTAGWADRDTTAVGGAGGDIILEVNGVQRTVTVAAGDTLNDLVDKINAQAGDIVTASINDDGTDSRPYRIEIMSDTGGDAGRVQVLQSPIDLSLNTQDAVLQDTSGWAGPTPTVVGQFTGDGGSVAVYNLTVQNVTGGGVVGEDAFEISWTVSWDGGAASAPTVITVPAGYTVGDSIEIEEGVFIQLGEGTVTNGDTLDIRAYSNDIDDAELGTYNGTSNTIVTGGNYIGSVNKTYSFAVLGSGSINDAGNLDTVTIRWTDSTGETGTVSVKQSNHEYEVAEGVTINFTTEGTLSDGDTFQVNVFANTQQQGQDKGLAQAAKAVHSGFADSTTTAITTSDGAFSYWYGGEKITVAVDGGSTLSQLAKAINNDEDNPGVTASIINDGLGLPTSYKLVLTGKDTGAQNQISHIEHDLDNFFGGGGIGGGFDVTQMATNSMVKVDGFPAATDIYLQRDENTISEVIPGVTLDIYDSGETVISVGTDLSAVYDKIEALINAVNYAQSYIRGETAFDSDGEETGILIGNYSYYILKSRIDTSLNESINAASEEAYRHLSQVGIKTDPDAEGAWVIDSATLVAAINADVDKVAALFVYDEDHGVVGVAKRVHSEMLALTDSSTGMLNVLISNYTSIVENIDKRIDFEEDRLELYRERQVQRFARLEASLAEMNAISSALESQIDQLPNNKSD